MMVLGSVRWPLLLSLILVISNQIGANEVQNQKERDIKLVQVDDQLININAELGPVVGLRSQRQRKIKYVGVNLSGAEFGDAKDLLGSTYDYPTQKDAQYFIQNGIQAFRIPVRWERMQPLPSMVGSNLFGPEIKYVDTLVNYITQNNKLVNLDIHNFCRYNGTIIGNPLNQTVVNFATPPQFASFFAALVGRYMNNPLIEFTVMNEPSEMPPDVWINIANLAIKSARATGYKGILYIDGNGWSGCYSWLQDFYGPPNAVAMLNITDPANNLVFDCHNYFNKDNSGGDPICVNQTIGADRAKDITLWLRKNKLRGIMGEFGAALSPSCMSSVKYLLDFIETNSDVWLGAYWWSAGPKWGNYYASIQPSQYTSAPKNQLVQLSYYSSGNYVGTL